MSVTYRQLTPEQIIPLAAQAGLSGIEWGSDVHVPERDPDRARRIGEATRAAGLHVSSYGTYYRLGQGQDIDLYLDAAQALGAPTLRLWAGTRGSAATDIDTRRAWEAEARLCAVRAAARGLTLGFEYHPGTLTDDAASALALMQAIDHPAARLYWQPDFSKPEKDILDGLETVLPYVDNLHVFTWRPDHSRLPLRDGHDFWVRVLRRLPALSSRYLLLEFVPGDAPEILAREASSLREIQKGGLSPRERENPS